MSQDALPPNESERLQALLSLQVLDTPAEERFDRLTRLARRLLRAPFCMLTMLDRERQWFKSAQGHLLAETPRTESFCAQTVLDGQPLMVGDASVDPRFFDLAVVAGEPHVRFYAGVPIHNSEGYAVGTFCVLDTQPRQLDEEEWASLRDLAACAESELQLLRLSLSEQELLREMDEVKRKASIDPLTRCWNRQSLLALLDKELRGVVRCAASLHVGGLDRVNDGWSQTTGDMVLREVSNRLRSALRPQDILGRISATRLLVISRCPLVEAEKYAQRLLDAAGQPELQSSGQPLPVSFSLGIAPIRAGEPGREALARVEKAEKTARARADGRALLGL